MSNFYTLEEERDQLRATLKREVALTAKLLSEREEYRSRLEDLIGLLAGPSPSIWPIRVLDAWALETKNTWSNDLSTRGDSAFYCVLGLGGDERWFEGETADVARFAAAREVFSGLTESKRKELGEWK